MNSDERYQKAALSIRNRLDSAIFDFEMMFDRVQMYLDIKEEFGKLVKEFEKSGVMPPRGKIVNLDDNLKQAADAFRAYYGASIGLKEVVKSVRDIVGEDLLMKVWKGEGNIYDVIERSERAAIKAERSAVASRILLRSVVEKTKNYS